MKFFIYKVDNIFDNSFSLKCCLENGQIVVVKKGFTNFYYYRDDVAGREVLIDPFEGPIKVTRKISMGTPNTEYQGKTIYNIYDDKIKFMNLYKYEFNRWYDNIEGEFIALNYLSKNEIMKYTISFDIEVEFRKSDLKIQDMISQPFLYIITMISFIIENKKIAFVNESYFQDDKNKINEYCNDSREIKIMNEKEMLKETFKLLTKYPFIVGYNSTAFDLLCVYYRGIELNLPYINECEYNIKYNSVSFLNSISVDLYLYYKNKAIKSYVYWNEYQKVSLDSVSQYILGRSKLKVNFEVFDFKYILYCIEDSALTWDLLFTEACDMILIFSRILKIGIETFIHTEISYWAQILVKNYMYTKGYLIPTKDHIRLKTHSVPRNYSGGLNLEPVSGIHQDIDVYDFTSLYPTILNYYNVSFETIDCGHDECKSNIVPGSGHYSCRLKVGIFPQIFGIIFNDRLAIKSLGNKNKDSQEVKFIDTYYIKGNYNTYLIYLIQFAYKILMNGGGYGMLGFQYFQFYNINAAESITMAGMYWLTELKKKMSLYDSVVLYGDTDSIFVKSIKSQKEILEYIRSFCPLKIEWDKRYKFLILTDRKKNYLGIKGTNKIDFKGLTLKKTNSPEFFAYIINEINQIDFDNINDVKMAKRLIFFIFKKYYTKINNKMLSKEELKIKTRLSQKIEDYKSNTEIVQLFDQFDKEENGNELFPFDEKDNPLRELKSGDFVEYYRSRNGPRLLDDISEPDWKKYQELLINACSQFFPNALSELKGIRKITSFM